MPNLWPGRRVFYGWWVLAIVSLAVCFQAGAGSFTFTTLIEPMTTDLGWSHTQLLGALTVAGILTGVISPLIGRMVDRYGARVVIVSGLLVLGVALVLTSRVQALYQFYLLYGVGYGLAQAAVIRVSSTALAANWFIRMRGIAFATYPASAALTGIVFVLSAQSILNWQDWRMVWLILGLAMIVVPVPLAWIVIRHRPEDMGLRPDGDDPDATGQREETSRTGRARLGPEPEVAWTLKEALATPTFWLLNLGLLLIYFPVHTIIVVMHPYLTEQGISSTTAARLLSFYAFSAFLGSVSVGTMVQLSSVRPLLISCAGLYGVAVILFVFVGGSSVPLLLVTLVPLGLLVTGFFQMGNQALADYYGRRRVGSIIGASNLINTLPLAAGPILAAGIHDSLGDYRPAFLLFAGFAFLAALALFFAKPPHKPVSTQASGLEGLS